MRVPLALVVAAQLHRLLRSHVHIRLLLLHERLRNYAQLRLWQRLWERNFENDEEVAEFK
jgi:hypothetical protein